LSRVRYVMHTRTAMPVPCVCVYMYIYIYIYIYTHTHTDVIHTWVHHTYDNQERTQVLAGCWVCVDTAVCVSWFTHLLLCVAIHVDEIS
jgi:hypothetical protein